MAILCPRFALRLLYCLGAVCLLPPSPARATLADSDAMTSEWDIHSQHPRLLAQAETSPVLPSLVLPPDATAGPPTFVAFTRMGDSAMLHGNIIQARSFYERAAAANPSSSAALLAVGKTYDPNILSSLGVNTIRFADPAMARRWYQRARMLGDPSAAEFMARLP